MKIAIMQPYYYPHMGYFELIKSVDKFVFLNNVQYIRRGWVNRNRIKWNNKWKYLTVPIIHCKQSTLIQDVLISGNKWKNEHIKSLCYSYGNDIVSHSVIRHLIDVEVNGKLFSLLMDTIKFVSNYLGISTEFLDSRNFPSENKKEQRLIDICKQIGATEYINSPGGRKLYDKEDFEKEGIKIEFMPPSECKSQLSILDVLLSKI